MDVIDERAHYFIITFVGVFKATIVDIIFVSSFDINM